MEGEYREKGKGWGRGETSGREEIFDI